MQISVSLDNTVHSEDDGDANPFHVVMVIVYPARQ